MTCLIQTSQIVRLSRAALRRLDEAPIQVGRAILFRFTPSFDPRETIADILRPAIIDAIDGNTITLRVLIQHDVVKPGRWT